MDSKLHWYAAYVKSCQEFKVAEALARLGIGYYLPLRREIRKWSDRRKVVERPVIARVIFVHATETDRVRALREIPALHRYITFDGPYTAAVIRDAEMETFQAMVELGGEKVELSAAPIAPGDRVRIVSGPLAGRQCEVVQVGSRHCVVARLGLIGTATMELSTATLEKIE
ncbi:MAG: UpxY family transcription antiterminator [Bacteroidales bacterium]|nr:UpxY family transcription antiterminator [Bacteroidales bacterium]